VDRVRDAHLQWGVPLAPVIEEMGFEVRVAAAGPGETAVPGVDRVRSAAELAEWFRDSRIAAAYTEYACDARLVDAGLAPFGPDIFEMGFAGAVRTLDRLLRRCRMSFFRTRAGAREEA